MRATPIRHAFLLLALLCVFFWTSGLEAKPVLSENLAQDILDSWTRSEGGINKRIVLSGVSVEKNKLFLHFSLNGEAMEIRGERPPDGGRPGAYFRFSAPNDELASLPPAIHRALERVNAAIPADPWRSVKEKKEELSHGTLMGLFGLNLLIFLYFFIICLRGGLRGDPANGK